MTGWRANAVRAQLCCIIFVVLVSGCSRMGKPGGRALDRRLLTRIESRLEGFKGMEGSGTVTVERAQEAIDVPFTMNISEDLVITVEGEPKHFLIPFEGSARLVSTDLGTVVHTSIGVFDVRDEAYLPSAIPAFLFSILMGGDGLVLWLGSHGCGPAGTVRCEGLEIKLDESDDLDSIEKWEIKGPDGRTLKASISEYERIPRLLPKVIQGTAHPDEIDFRIEYEYIRWIEG